MTHGVQDLIKAIDSGDSQTIDAAFQAEMANRISTRLEDLRVSVAQNMFATEHAIEETEVEEEVSEAEEIEEDVEQIDELSKKTLGSYTKKAANDLGDKAHELGQNGEEPDYEDDDDKSTETYTGALRRGVDNRQAGIKRAVNKLTK
jgi:hypothetical protein